MRLRDQVCSFEQAKRLNELGVVQAASAFYYDNSEDKLKFNGGYEIDGHVYFKASFYFSAFTVAELGVMDTGTVIGSSFWLRNFHGNHIQLLHGKDKVQFDGDNEAQCRAALLIHIIENGLAAVEEINERLRGIDAKSTTEQRSVASKDAQR